MAFHATWKRGQAPFLCLHMSRSTNAAAMRMKEMCLCICAAPETCTIPDKEGDDCIVGNSREDAVKRIRSRSSGEYLQLGPDENEDDARHQGVRDESKK